MKKTKILIVSLIAILVLGCAVFAVLYFTTDIFKEKGSNKEKFNKYISQMNFKDFVDRETLNSNLQRQQNEAYLNNGYIDIDIRTEGETFLDEKIEYNSKVDPINNKASSEINIEIDGKKELTVDYLANEDLYGIRFRDIINQYLVLNNNNLDQIIPQELKGNIKVSIPNKIEIPQNIKDNLNEEQLKQMLTKYISIVEQAIPEQNYSSVENQKINIANEEIKANGYILKIDSAVLNSVLNRVLETAKSDEQIFNIFSKVTNQEFSLEQYQQMIDGTIEGIKIDENFAPIYITVFVNKEETIKIQIKYAEQLNLDIQKSGISANMVDEDGQIMQFNFNKNIDGTYEMAYIINEAGTEKVNVNVKFNNTTVFDPNIEIEDYSQINHAVINKYSSNQLQKLFGIIIKELNDKTNIKNGFIGKVFSSIITMNSSVINSAQNAAEEAEKQMEKEATKMFNAMLVFYEGEQTGASVRTLINRIEDINSSNLEHIIKYTESNVELNKIYNVSFEKDSEGYINKVIIE